MDKPVTKTDVLAVTELVKQLIEHAGPEITKVIMEAIQRKVQEKAFNPKASKPD